MNKNHWQSNSADNRTKPPLFLAQIRILSWDEEKRKKTNLSFCQNICAGTFFDNIKRRPTDKTLFIPINNHLN